MRRALLVLLFVTVSLHAASLPPSFVNKVAP
jgi:hypothetical protein